MNRAAGAERKTDLWLAGQHVVPSSGRYFVDRNPEDDSPYAQVAEGSLEDIDRAVQTAQAAFASYGRTLACEREAWLARAAALLERYRSEFVDILIDEVGSPFGKAQF